MAQFMPPALKKKSKLIVPTPDGAKLEAVSTVIVEPEYRTIFKEAEAETSSPLSSLLAGKYIATVDSTSIEEGTTAPPSAYTQASLMKDMSRIAKYIDDPEIKKIMLEKDKGKRAENGSIGTEATRASIISGLIAHQYLEQDKKGKIRSTVLGRELCRILPEELAVQI